MRRLFLPAVGLMPLALLFGCNHLAGKCDCDRTPTLACPCYYEQHPVVTAAAPVPTKPVEPIKEAPKEAPKDPPKPSPVPDKEE
jgi:hypothetical protein